MLIPFRVPRLAGLSLALLVCLACISCSGGGPKLNPVQGKVLHKSQPIPGVLVTFHPVGNDGPSALRPTGLSKEDGSFTLTTGQAEGAPAGEYVVTMICSEVPSTKGKKVISTGGIDTQDRFGGAYSLRENSQFKVEIKSGANQLQPFDLK
jgi:hypothetical protein